MEKKKLICIVGATASGKTGLGVELAKRFNGEIVSADSRQVYRGLDIGTGKDLEEYDNIRYHLINICDPGENFSLFDWLERAKEALADIWSRGKIPIVVGGTGLYVQALVEGFVIDQKSKIKSLSRLPAESEGAVPRDQNCNSKVKTYSREDLEHFELEKLQQIANKLKPNSCKLIDTNNPRRLIRFVERTQAGDVPTRKKPDFDHILIGKDLPREELYKKIDDRVEEWFRSGFYEEVNDLLNSGVRVEWLNKVGLEYRILGNYISNLKSQISNPQFKSVDLDDVSKNALRMPGKKPYVMSSRARYESRDSFINKEISPPVRQNSQSRNGNDLEFDAMKQAMKYAIHQYARRQLTWWRRFEVEWTNNTEDAEKIVSKFMSSQ